jgi:hypothetical protein
MGRKGTVIAVRPTPAVIARFVCSTLRRFALGDGLLQIFKPELQLIRAELFGAAAKLMAQQALDQQAKLVVLGFPLRSRSNRLTHIRCRIAGSSGRAARSICTRAW